MRWAQENKDVIFHRGVVKHTSWGQTGSLTQIIETETKSIGTNGFIKLIGETYAYWCAKCHATVWEQELNMLQPMRSGDVTKQRCPFCESPMNPLQPGDKVRVHYRFHPEGRWGAFWAERWDW